eukprot:6186440-Pleurochrysis_carterae.AAC.4
MSRSRYHENGTQLCRRQSRGAWFSPTSLPARRAHGRELRSGACAVRDSTQACALKAKRSEERRLVVAQRQLEYLLLKAFGPVLACTVVENPQIAWRRKCPLRGRSDDTCLETLLHISYTRCLRVKRLHQRRAGEGWVRCHVLVCGRRELGHGTRWQEQEPLIDLAQGQWQ